MDSALPTIGCSAVLAAIAFGLLISGTVRRRPLASTLVLSVAALPLAFFAWLAAAQGSAWQGVLVLDELPADAVPGTWANGNIVAVFLADGGVVRPDGGPFPCSATWTPAPSTGFDVTNSGRWYALKKNRTLLLLCERDWDEDHWDIRWALSKRDAGVTAGAIEPVRCEPVFKKIGPDTYDVLRVTCPLRNEEDPRMFARLTPIDAGAWSGFRLTSIRPGSLYDRAGLVDGDVVISANGLTLATPEAALSAYSRLRDADTITLEVERAGGRLRLRYLVHD